MAKKLTGSFITVCFIFLFASYSFGATLRWSPVESTAECTIAGYKVHYGTTSGTYTSTVDAGDTTSYDLDLLGLVPTQTYYFSVSAYSTINVDGPMSSPVPYRDSPEVVGIPVIDFTNDTIDITFNESSMQGAFTKENYTFSPSIQYDNTRAILLTDKTYRLYMIDIPEHTIFTLTLINITDNNGNTLIDNTITLNDDDGDDMPDDWEADYGITSAFSDADSDGVDNQMEYTIGTNPLSSDSDNDGMDDGWELENGQNPLVSDTSDDPTPTTIPDTDNPELTVTPIIDYKNNMIDITFNESDMIGATTKTNYKFSPTVLFDDTRAILLTDKTYRLYMIDIPEHTIFTLTLINITDNNGNTLIDNTITLNDDDDDGMADDWEADYGITSAFSDADSDGVDNQMEYTIGTNPLSSDSDNDGMDDYWEIQNGLNPLVDDTDEDNDNDGPTNFEEYIGGSGASNTPPEKPVLLLPTDGTTDIGLTPELQTGTYVDAENDTQIKSQWQISTESSFTDSENIVFELESYDVLTTLDVPGFILDAGKTYYWRVRFFDSESSCSQWSDAFSFETQVANPEDGDEDGIPDVQQVTNGVIDLNDDKIYDVASDTYKMAESGSLQFAMEASNNVQSIDCLKAIDPDDIFDNTGKPSDLPFGLLEFRVRVYNVGDTALVRLYFSEPVGPTWYKYDLQNGWTDYSGDYPANVQLSSDGKSVLLRLVDGGAGDSDGVANGVIVDPSGPGAALAAVVSSPITSSAPGGGGGCFIATAAFGSQLEKHVQILRNFRDFYLLKSKAGTTFVRTYYKYSPPIADVIAKNAALRAVVRVGLMPLIAYGYAAVYLTPIQQCAVAVLMIGLMGWTATRVRRYLKTSSNPFFQCKKMGFHL